MTTPTPSFAFFVVLLCMVMVWFVLIKLLCSRLEAVHPEKYAAMGKPSLFRRNNFTTGWAILKFLLAREHRALNDGYLSRLADAMLVFLVIYLLLFLWLYVNLSGSRRN